MIFNLHYLLAGILVAISPCHCAKSVELVESVSIQGEGGGYPAPVYAKWITTFVANHSGVKINYEPSGTGHALGKIIDHKCDFAGSDIPLTENQLKKAATEPIHIPTLLAPVVMVYNLKGIEELKLDGPVLASIYLGEITRWNDPKIADLNPGITLPQTNITVIHRSDGIWTSWVFVTHLSKVSEKWKTTIGSDIPVKWPVGVGGKGGSFSVTQIARETEGSIGYEDLQSAESSKLKFVTLINISGKSVKPSIEGAFEAVKHFEKNIPEDLRSFVCDSPGDASYPICGFSYLLIYEDLSYLKDIKKAEALVKFIDWCIHDGQAIAKELNYAPLPEELQKKIEAKLKTVVFDGKPVLAK